MGEEEKATIKVNLITSALLAYCKRVVVGENIYDTIYLV